MLTANESRALVLACGKVCRAVVDTFAWLRVRSRDGSRARRLAGDTKRSEPKPMFARTRASDLAQVPCSNQSWPMIERRATWTAARSEQIQERGRRPKEESLARKRTSPKGSGRARSKTGELPPKKNRSRAVRADRPPRERRRSRHAVASRTVACVFRGSVEVAPIVAEPHLSPPSCCRRNPKRSARASPGPGARDASVTPIAPKPRQAEKPRGTKFRSRCRPRTQPAHDHDHADIAAGRLVLRRPSQCRHWRIVRRPVMR